MAWMSLREDTSDSMPRPSGAHLENREEGVAGRPRDSKAFAVEAGRPVEQKGAKWQA